VAPPRAWKPLRAPAAAPSLELLHFIPFGRAPKRALTPAPAGALPKSRNNAIRNKLAKRLYFDQERNGEEERHGVLEATPTQSQGSAGRSRSRGRGRGGDRSRSTRAARRQVPLTAAATSRRRRRAGADGSGTHAYRFIRWPTCHQRISRSTYSGRPAGSDRLDPMRQHMCTADRRRWIFLGRRKQRPIRLRRGKRFDRNALGVVNNFSPSTRLSGGLTCQGISVTRAPPWILPAPIMIY